MAGTKKYAVAASGRWWDEEDGRWLPAGEVHGWLPGTNQTVCGLALTRSQLVRLSAIDWTETFPESGGAADRVQRVCPRCASVCGRRPSDSRGRGRRHVNPRP